METTSSLETRAQQFYSVQAFTSFIFQMNAEMTFTTAASTAHISQEKSILMKESYKYSCCYFCLFVLEV